MKVLYLGNWRDGTGWGNAAQGYILSLDAAGVNVVPRHIKLNNREVEIPERILELERRSDKDCDVVIQHVLPHHLDYNGSFDKNIALYVTETDHCKNTVWPERLNLMDECWIPNHDMLNNAKNSNICAPMHIVPHACDIYKYQAEYEPLQMDIIKDKFVFYYIGEHNRRKNLMALIKAFHLEFGCDEGVALVLKAHIPEESVAESEKYLREMANTIKDGLKLYPQRSMYHPEIFICQYLSDVDIMRLHATCDCFVSPSFGEAWGIPTFDAMAMGKTPISTSTGGPKDYLTDCGWLVDAKKESCFGMVDSFSEMYAGNEKWDRIDLEALRKAMRDAYTNSEDRLKKADAGINRAYEYSYETVGLHMKNILENKTTPHFGADRDFIHEKHSIKKLIS